MQKAFIGLLILASIVAAGVIWGRFIWAVNQPSSARFMTIQLDGKAAEAYLFCFDPAFIDGDTLWRNCSYNLVRTETEYHEVNVMVHYDMRSGAAEIHARFPEEDNLAGNLALAKNAAGDFALVKNEQSAPLYRMNAGGGVERLFTLEANEIPYGLVWQGDVIEVVHGPTYSADAVITTVQPDGETRSREVNLLDCEESEVCRLELAYYEDAAWHFVYSRVPADITANEIIAADLLESVESGTPSVIGRLPLDFEHHYTIEEGQFKWLRYRTYLDGSRANLVMNYYGWQPFEWNGDSWQPLELPPDTPADYDIASHYFLGENHLTWLPKVELTYYSSAYRFNQQWIPLEELVDTDLMISHHYDVLWPAENGGYWYLGNERSYVQLDPTLERSDGLSFSERLAQLTGDYDPRSSWAWFYREKRTLKMLSFPLLLFFLPAAAGLAARFRGELSWFSAMRYISIAYLLMLLFFRTWFWEMTALF